MARSGTPQPLFIGRIEALRGVAALLVAGLHIGQSQFAGGSLLYSPGSEGLAGRLLRHATIVLLNGHGAVALFFVISGFVLGLSLRRGPSRPAALAADFLVARLLRIYPAAVAAILAFALLFWLSGRGMPYHGPATFRLANLALNAALFRLDIDGVMWTVQIEALAAPFILATFLIERRAGPAAVLAVAIALVVASFHRAWPPIILPDLRPLACLYAFPIGMLVPSLGRAATGLPPRPAAILSAIAVVAFLAARPLLGYGSNLAGLIESLSSAVLVAVLAYGPSLRGAGFLDWTAARLLGRISYSFYLLHPLTLTVAWAMPQTLTRLVAAGLPRSLLELGLAAVSVAVILPLALLSYRAVELPGIRLGRALRRWRPAPVPAAPAG